MLRRKRFSGVFLFPIALLLFPLIGAAQERCGTVQYMKKMGWNSAGEKQFEQWVGWQSLQERNARTKRTKATLKIPVVVHVIHRGEKIGDTTNISDAQVISQINVLNKDFRRLNADAANTPAEFLDEAGSMDVEFILAKQDPEGLATNGIVRVKGQKKQWTSNDNYQLKSQSYWPAEDYLNIWVCDITDFLGYTQFPQSNLPGHENSSTNRLTDGIVVSYLTIGSIDDGPFKLDPDFNKGRTVTHEMGHFLGLLHVWGDDSGLCSGSDYVDDTPNQAGHTNGCPSHPRVTCNVPAMFQNFLDYSDDNCMNLFTKGQVSRMTTIVQNSPRRASLLTSHGLLDPSPVPNDLGIRNIISPQTTACGTAVIPVIEIRNYGSNSVTSTRIRVTVDGNVVETKDFTLNLGYLESTPITFQSQTLSPGNHTITFQILLTNGVTDGSAQNNLSSRSFSIPQFDTVPFTEPFNSVPPKWTIQNPDQQTTWQNGVAKKDTPSNKAMFINFYDYEDSFGEVDVLLTPVYDLAAVPLASLSFEVAYARFQGNSDRLKVVVLKNCQTIESGTVIYDKAGTTLATVSSTNGFFTPSGQEDWRKEVINVSQFIGETHVQFAFVAINDWGNYLYLDNVSLLTTPIEDLALQALESPSIVTCDDRPAPRISVLNMGTVTITSFNVVYSVNGGASQTFPVTGLSLESGERTEIILDAISLNEGENSISIDITEPNSAIDESPANNKDNFVVVVNKASDRIPYRENFNQDFESEWTIVNPTGGMEWKATSTNFDKSIYFDSYNNTTIDDEAWLVSPVLDFSGATTASMVFDISYRTRLGQSDIFMIMASSDCGNTYQELSAFVTPGESFSPWLPKTENDWQKNVVVNLNQFAGLPQVRIAFVVINQNANNLYIDNVEFFTTEEPDFIEINELYSVYGYDNELSGSALKITFNLPERKAVQYAVVDMMGRTYAEATLPDILNQTYSLELQGNLTPGMYIIRVKIGETWRATKVLINR